MLCSIISLIMVFVMAVPMTVSAAEVTVTTADQLKAEVAKGGDITLGADIEASIEIPQHFARCPVRSYGSAEHHDTLRICGTKTLHLL